MGEHCIAVTNINGKYVPNIPTIRFGSQYELSTLPDDRWHWEYRCLHRGYSYRIACDSAFNHVMYSSTTIVAPARLCSVQSASDKHHSETLRIMLLISGPRWRCKGAFVYIVMYDDVCVSRK